MSKLERLHQVKSAASYSHRFAELLIEIGSSITEESALRAYLKNLKPAVSIQTRLQAPLTVVDAMKLAEIADNAIWEASRTDRPAARPMNSSSSNGRGRAPPGPPSRTPARPANYTGPQPMELGALSALTDTERAKMMSEGRCFKCRQTGHRANTCPTRRPPNRPTPARGN